MIPVVLAACGGPEAAGPTAGFTLSLSASIVAVTQGGSGQVTLTVTPQGGFQETVYLALQDVPAGVSMSPTAVNVTGAQPVLQTITVAVPLSVEPQTYAVTLEGSATDLRRSVPLSLEVRNQVGTSSTDVANSVAVDAVGNVYVVGGTGGSLGGANKGFADVFLARFDGSGVPLSFQQFGTNLDDFGNRVVVDGVGNVYVAGVTQGSLSGTNQGSYDAFLAKYDASDTQLWLKQFGTSFSDWPFGMATDAEGNVFVAGTTEGALPSRPIQSFAHAFLAKYDGAGAQLWVQQLDTSSIKDALGVAVDVGGNVYVAGSTNGNLGGPNQFLTDAFLAKFDRTGTQLWVKQLGTGSTDVASSVAVDAVGNVYLAGYTFGSLGGPNQGEADVFLARYDRSGTQLWVEQFGTTSFDEINGVAVDSGGQIYVAGVTEGALGDANQGFADAFLAKYDGTGKQLWVKQLGTSSTDVARGVAVDAGANAYVAGYTDGSLDGLTHGGRDGFLAKYDGSGTQLWVKQFGAASQLVAVTAAEARPGRVHDHD